MLIFSFHSYPLRTLDLIILVYIFNGVIFNSGQRNPGLLCITLSTKALFNYDANGNNNEAAFWRNKAPGPMAGLAEPFLNWISSAVLKIMSPAVASLNLDIA